MAASLQVRASCQVDEFKKDWLSWGEALGDVLGLESSEKSSGRAGAPQAVPCRPLPPPCWTAPVVGMKVAVEQRRLRQRLRVRSLAHQAS